MSNIIEKACKFCEIIEFRDQDLSQLNVRNDILSLAINLCEEELQETKVACNQRTALSLKEFWKDGEVVDGFGDLAFVAINGIYKYFRIRCCEPEEALNNTFVVLERICAANLKKIYPDGSVMRDTFGKVLKPDGWKAPQYDDLFIKRYVDDVE